MLILDDHSNPQSSQPTATMARLAGVERPDDSGLRERKTKPVEEPVKQPTAGNVDGAAAQAKKTIGRTPDGTGR